jgi:chitodextrinase
MRPTGPRAGRRTLLLTVLAIALSMLAAAPALASGSSRRRLSAPTNLVATPGDQRASLSWGASSGAIGYDVYRGGSQVAQTASTSLTDTGLVDGTSYPYHVVAYGNSGARSQPSGTASVTPKDVTAPTPPRGLVAVSGNAQVSIAWSASTDNVGVAGYRVFRDGTQVAQTGTPTFTDLGLANATLYTYYVTAYDAAGNVSAPSTGVSATPTAPATPVASVTNWDPSGQPMPVGDVPGWHQVFADNFANDHVPVGSFSGCSWPSGALITQLNCTGLAAYPNVEAKWFAYPDGWSGTPTTGTYEPSQVMSIEGGMMNYNIHTANGVHMIAAAVPKIPGGAGILGGMSSGRYVVRARMDPLYGYHASFLLWPDSNVWPADGEIDWPEGDFDSTGISAFMHWQGGTSGASQDAYEVSASFNQWHTYAVDWTSSQCSFYMDGNLVGSSTDAANIPSTLMHLVLQTGTSFGESTPAAATAGNVQIDWVTAYAPG